MSLYDSVTIGFLPLNDDTSVMMYTLWLMTQSPDYNTVSLSLSNDIHIE